MIKVNGEELQQSSFPDGTLLIKHFPDTTNTIYWKYESDSELFTLYCLKRHIDEHHSDAIVDLILPYIPNARQDRVKNIDDVFTLKYFCEIINSMNFSNVFVYDAHSNVSLALLNRVHQMPIKEFVKRAMCDAVSRETHLSEQYIYLTTNDMNSDIFKDFVLFFPDEGAMKRYSSIMKLPYAFGIKDRDWDSGEIRGLKLMNGDIVDNKNILIIDDICSKGGTFYHSSKALKEAGAKNIYLYVTHCENTIAKGSLLTSDLIQHIYTTNSILTINDDKITILS